MSAPVRTIRYDRSTQGDPAQPKTTKELYADPTGTFKTGFWAAKPGRSEISYELDEMCTLIEGVVRLTDTSGHVETYRAGDTFLIPNGFKGVWETVEPVRKFYAVYKPKAG